MFFVWVGFSISQDMGSLEGYVFAMLSVEMVREFWVSITNFWAAAIVAASLVEKHDCVANFGQWRSASSG